MAYKSNKEECKIACVTGASGKVGHQIVKLLLQKEYKVRVLTRRKYLCCTDVEVFQGTIDDEALLEVFLHNCTRLFHCAAELSDTSKMWQVNVEGTQKLLRMASKSGVEYLCHLSSAGVVGKTYTKHVKEDTTCNPRNLYEHSKWTAEQIVQQGLPNCRVVILRPTNVITDEAPGVLSLPMRSSWSDCLKVFLKGGEGAHIVHAMDVADAAIYLISHTADGPSCFFVSCDHEQLNTLAGLWSFYRAIERSKPVEAIKPIIHLPIIVPYLLRKLWRGTSNLGSVRYSSEKLLSTGFRYRLGLEGAVRRIISTKQPIGQ